VSYAGFWRRYWAALFDGFFFGIGFWVLFFSWSSIYSVAMGEPVSFELVGYRYVAGLLTGWLLTWPYFAGMESSAAQATPGKIAMGIAVTDLAGDRLGFGRATARFFAKNLSAALLLIGFVIAGFTEKKQALHDLLTDSLVIRKHNPNERVFWNLGLLTVLGVVLLMVVVRVEQARQERQAKEAEAQRLEQARQEEEAKQEQARKSEAVRLVKESHVYDAIRRKQGDFRDLNTEEVLEERIQRKQDVSRVVGWKVAAARNPYSAGRLYLVCYSWETVDSRKPGWCFEVDLVTQQVTRAGGHKRDQEIEERYGVRSFPTPNVDPTATTSAAEHGQQEARH
jgi:uncharacterized RDD family membrane protein YckC